MKFTTHVCGLVIPSIQGKISISAMRLISISSGTYTVMSRPPSLLALPPGLSGAFTKIIMNSPACPRSALRPLPSWTHLKHLT